MEEGSNPSTSTKINKLNAETGVKWLARTKFESTLFANAGSIPATSTKINKLNMELVSECCGAGPWLGDTDYERCGDCKEWCEFVDLNEE